MARATTGLNPRASLASGWPRHGAERQDVGVERIAIALVVVAVVGTIAFVVNRRQAIDGPTQPKVWPVPGQLDRNDFIGPAVPWLLVVFTSSVCDTCERIVRMAEPMASPQVSVQVVPYQARKDLHQRYSVEAVPCVALADADGVVHVGFVGSTISATDLWAAVAEAREPGTSPEPHLGRVDRQSQGPRTPAPEA